ncbi:MAG: GNAT family N-acetyltransferase [Litorimonas sp.]
MLENRGKVEFRIISDADREFLFDVYASSREWEFTHTVWTAEEKEKFLRGQFKVQDQAYQMTYLGAIRRIIQLDGKDIGRLYVDRQDDHLLIIDFAILSQFRNRGIGSDILKSLINEAYGAKVPVKLHVLRASPALEFYERHGFKKTHVEGHHFAMEWRADYAFREI